MDDDALDVAFVRESARDYLAAGSGSDLRSLGSMDWLGLLVTEDRGGSGWEPLVATVIAEELGRARATAPWVSSMVCATAVSWATADLRDRLLPGLLAGTTCGALAVHGAPVRVTHADVAEFVLVLGPDGVGLSESVPLATSDDDASLDLDRPSVLIDLTRHPCTEIGDARAAHVLTAVTRLLVAADSVGALAAARERLVDYLRDRIAFGSPIAAFQAVQHRLADLLVFEVRCRALIAKAARRLGEQPGGNVEAVPLAAAAHAFVMSSVVAMVDECVQLSGGIGFSWEYPLHHDLRRVTDNSVLVGTARRSAVDYAGASGW